MIMFFMLYLIHFILTLHMPVAGLCASHGPGYLAGCAALAGILQITAGSAGVSYFVYRCAVYFSRPLS